METLLSGIFALVIGSGGVWAGLQALRHRRLLQRWPTAKGRVIERGTFHAVIGRRGFRFAPLVRYVYQVDEKEFVNNYINPKRTQLPSHSTEQWAQKKAASWPDEVTVHYNPASPDESFLVQTPKFKLYLVIIASGVAVLFGALFLISYLQR
ncbi:MAG: DUF3592 domain-containing protein [Acidobacteriota bacterium]